MKTIFELLAERKKELVRFDSDEESNALSAWYEPQLLLASKKLSDAIDSNTSRRLKIYKIQTIISEIRENPAARTACKKGCSNCCYQQVKISQTEADAIGARIGRKAHQLRVAFKMKDVNAYGRETPCTFLVGGACSIYQNRPFVCREFVNSDRDNLLCSFENWDLLKANDDRYVHIPRPSAAFLHEAYISISGASEYGDIRDFFPN